MACLITSGRLEPCKDSLGGLRNIFIANYVADGFTIEDGEVTAIDAAITEVFQYALRADGNIFDQNGTSDDSTGVSTWEQTLTVALKKLDKNTSNQMKLLAQGYSYIIIEDYNGNYHLMGALEGTSMRNSNFQTGGAKTDFNGYNGIFNATVECPAPFLDSATITALLAIVSATNIAP